MSFSILGPDYCLVPEELYYVTWKKYYQDYHTHKEGSIEFDYIADGSCIYHFQNQTVSLSRRSLLIHNGANSHDYFVPESCLNMSILCVQKKISPHAGTFQDLLTASPYLQSFFNHLDEGILLKNAGSLYPAVKEINNTFSAGSSPYYLNLLINKLLIDSLNAAYFQTPSRIYTQQIKDYIHYHYFSIQNLDEIAERLSLNKIYIERVFRQETGMSIWNYLNNIRMEKALYYVVNPTLPIGEIDELVGIHSRQNFYMLFRKKYNMSPQQYRKAYLSGAVK